MRLFAVAYSAMCSSGFGVKIETEAELRERGRIREAELGDRADQEYFDYFEIFLKDSTPSEIIYFGDDTIVTIGNVINA